MNYKSWDRLDINYTFHLKKKKGQTSLLAEQEINTETISNVPETARSFAEVIWTDYMELS